MIQYLTTKRRRIEKHPGRKQRALLYTVSNPSIKTVNPLTPIKRLAMMLLCNEREKNPE